MRQAGALSRRHLLQGIGVVGSALLVGCEKLPFPRQPPKVPRIGFLAVGTREGRAPLIAGFLQGLHEHGYVEGQTIHIEYRFSDGRDERLPELAAELVALQVTLIVASGTPASFAAKRATDTVPIVMGGLAADPVETGLIASLARPGGNVTGMSMMTSPLAGKRLELLREIVPSLKRVAVVWNPTNPAYGPILRELEAAAPVLGLALLRVEARVPEDLESACAAAARQGAGALVVPADPLTTNRPQMVADLALQYRLPAIMDLKEFAVAGGLMALGVNLADLYRRAAKHVDRILKGANPGELPMEQPLTLDLVVNARTAAALGLTLPPSVLLQANEVIQ